MAMCRASARAFEGKAALFNNARASVSASGMISSDRRSAKKPARLPAAAGSPSAHSRCTSSETTTSKELRRRLHHSCVNCCRPATITSREGQAVRLEVADNGDGADGELAGSPSTGVGLANIRDRLSQAYGAAHRFEARQNERGGFSVIIEIPFETGDKA